MDFKDLVQQRRSIRKYSDKKLSPEQVQLIMRAALMSPASKRANPWQFILVEDKDTLKKLSGCKKMASALIEDCALAVVVVADPLTSNVWIEDASIATIMMQLQAEDLGLGSCWVQIRNRKTAMDTCSEEYVRVLLNIPLQLQVLSIVAIGHKGQERPPFDEEKLQWEKIHVGTFELSE